MCTSFGLFKYMVLSNYDKNIWINKTKHIPKQTMVLVVTGNVSLVEATHTHIYIYICIFIVLYLLLHLQRHVYMTDRVTSSSFHEIVPFVATMDGSLLECMFTANFQGTRLSTCLFCSTSCKWLTSRRVTSLKKPLISWWLTSCKWLTSRSRVICHCSLKWWEGNLYRPSVPPLCLPHGTWHPWMGNWVGKTSNSGPFPTDAIPMSRKT